MHSGGWLFQCFVCSPAEPFLPFLPAGRIFLGFGIGFANQSVPLYLSEMAPSQYRGGMNILVRSLSARVLAAFFLLLVLVCWLLALF
jgi:MFS family permease